MKTLLITVCMAFGLFAAQNVSAQTCPAMERPCDLVNGIDCSTTFTIYYSGGGNSVHNLGSQSVTSNLCITDEDVTSCVVNVSGGGSVTITPTSQSGNSTLCPTPGFSTFNATGSGWLSGGTFNVSLGQFP